MDDGRHKEKDDAPDAGKKQSHRAAEVEKTVEKSVPSHHSATPGSPPPSPLASPGEDEATKVHASQLKTSKWKQQTPDVGRESSKVTEKPKAGKSAITDLLKALSKPKATDSIAWEVMDKPASIDRKGKRRKKSMGSADKRPGSTESKLSGTPVDGKVSAGPTKVDATSKIYSVKFPDAKVVKVIRDEQQERFSVAAMPALSMKSAIKDRTTVLSAATNRSQSKRSVAPSTKTNVDWEGHKIPKPVSRKQCLFLAFLFMVVLAALVFLILFLTETFKEPPDTASTDSTTTRRATDYTAQNAHSVKRLKKHIYAQFEAN